MIEYRYVADLPPDARWDGSPAESVPVSFPTLNVTPERESQLLRFTQDKYGKKVRVRVEQRDVTEWTQVGALL